MPIADFNEAKESVSPQSLSRQYKLAGLVVDAQHRTTKNGKQFGVFGLEDYSGKMEIALFGEDYVKCKDHFELGNVLFVTGGFKARWNSTTDFEFKISSVMLLETVKKTFTRQIQVTLPPKDITENMISFFDKNIRSNPGKASIKFVLASRSAPKIGLYTLERGLEINDELTAYLEENPDWDISVQLTDRA